MLLLPAFEVLLLLSARLKASFVGAVCGKSEGRRRLEDDAAEAELEAEDKEVGGALVEILFELLLVIAAEAACAFASACSCLASAATTLLFARPRLASAAG